MNMYLTAGAALMARPPATNDRASLIAAWRRMLAAEPAIAQIGRREFESYVRALWPQDKGLWALVLAIIDHETRFVFTGPRGLTVNREPVTDYGGAVDAGPGQMTPVAQQTSSPFLPFWMVLHPFWGTLMVGLHVIYLRSRYTHANAVLWRYAGRDKAATAEAYMHRREGIWPYYLRYCSELGVDPAAESRLHAAVNGLAIEEKRQ